MAKLPNEKVLLASDLYHFLGEVPGDTPIGCEQTCDGVNWFRAYFTAVSLEKSDELPEDTINGHLPISGPIILLGGETTIDPPKEEENG